MVRSTTIFRVSDALPLAASVDDENVSPPCYFFQAFPPLAQLDQLTWVDRESSHRVQAAIKARISPPERQQRTGMFHRVGPIHPPVRNPFTHRHNRGRKLTTFLAT
jgi:hypothetical protein